jgi:CubicO group peptidase (beta-lactamase class C family)/tetratricopeptide (TPR) repeat protein
MKKSIIFLLLVSGTIVCTSFFKDKTKGTIKNKINNLLKWEEKFGFSGAVLVVKDGEIILNKGYGYANKAAGFFNSPKTIFYIASVSKPITALGVMKLVEEERISLSDCVTKYFTNVPENKKAITIEMLLTHTSGLKHTYSCDNIADRSKAIEKILNETPLVAAPGVKYNYSGDNYTLLAAIIEIASGETFETFVAKNVLRPAGIDKQAFTGNMQEEQYNDFASPAKNSPYKSLKDIEATWGRKGRAGMILSVEDLYKLDRALTENKILHQNTVSDILSPKIKSGNGSNYGYGFSIDKSIRGTKVFGHSGDDDGVGHNVDYLDFPDEKVKIFIASNSGMYSGTSWSAVISTMLQRFLFKTNYTYPSDKLFYNEFINYSPESLEKYEGVYQSGNTAYHVWINNNQQLILSPVGNDVAQTFNYSEAYTGKNTLARSILEETHNRQYTLLPDNSKDNASFESLKTIINGFWESLEKKNGPLDRIEILGTANIWSANYQADIATWFRLVFKNKTLLYRIEWDGNNKIAGLGGNRIPYPMMFTLNGIAKGEFIGFDVANGRTIAVNFSGVDSVNKNTLEINSGQNKPLILYNNGNTGVLPVRSAAELLYSIITTKGIAATIEEATAIKEGKLNRFEVDEGELNDTGYRLLNEKKLDEAIALFTILVQAFPESSNAFDSLGEAYMKAGNKTEAIKNYKKSLELDPKNKSAEKMIKILNN